MSDLIAADVAEAELDRFIDSMGLDLDTAQMDDDDLAAYQRQRAKLLHALRKGALVINDDGAAVYTPCRPASRCKTTPATPRSGSSTW